jgi:hypothetical protein
MLIWYDFQCDLSDRVLEQSEIEDFMVEHGM